MIGEIMIGRIPYLPLLESITKAPLRGAFVNRSLFILPAIQICAAMGAMLIRGKWVISFRDISATFGTTAFENIQNE